MYICNVCGKEYKYEIEAVRCHPNVIEKEYELETFKNRGGGKTSLFKIILK